MRIKDLPFHERPIDELLALGGDLTEESARLWAGFGWARVPEIWLNNELVTDALVVAVHADDDGEPVPDDIEIAFELPDRDEHERNVTMLVSEFANVWLPRLPSARTTVLLVCNPYRATLRMEGLTFRYPRGEARAWRTDRAPGIRLQAETWCTLGAVSNDLMTRPAGAIDDDKKYSLAGLYLLKKMDLKPKEGGQEFPTILPNELSPLDDVFQHMALDGLVEIDKRTFGADRWKMTKKGIERLRIVIDEASAMVDEFDEYDVDEAIEEIRSRNLDVFRARFLWGWFEGEFDDLVAFQERRGVSPAERMWAIYLTGDDFWHEIAKDLEE